MENYAILLCGDTAYWLKELFSWGILVDSVIVDPPFAISNDKNSKNDFSGYTSFKGDWDEIPPDCWVEDSWKLLKQGGTFSVFGVFGSLVPIYNSFKAFSDATMLSHSVWWKSNPAPCKNRRSYTLANEIILTYAKGSGWTFNYAEAKELNGGKQLHNVWRNGSTKRVLGRTRKPVGVLDKLIIPLTNTRDVVLDPFCGTGSIGEECLLKERNYIGIDKSEEVIEFCEKRFVSMGYEVIRF